MTRRVLATAVIYSVRQGLEQTRGFVERFSDRRFSDHSWTSAKRACRAILPLRGSLGKLLTAKQLIRRHCALQYHGKGTRSIVAAVRNIQPPRCRGPKVLLGDVSRRCYLAVEAPCIRPAKDRRIGASLHQ